MPQIVPAAMLGALQRDADLCVKCGLCLPHCPTYRVTLDEAESPRGRIALMQGLASGQLAASATLEAHLDGCLTCRACEVVCPALVPYGRMIDASRELLAQQRPERTRLVRALAFVLTRKPVRFAVALALALYRRLGLQFLVRRLQLLGRGRLARLESLLPPIHLPLQPRGSAAPGPSRVALFTNCTSPLVEPETLAAAITLLTPLDGDVAVPRAQTCCGALHLHGGAAAPARACAAQNIDAFAAAKTVVGIASGCTAALVEYGLLQAGPEAAAFAAKTHDIHAYIAAHPRAATLEFRELRARVLLHTPCTLRNVLKGGAHVRALLERIPGLAIDAMDGACCGAAGSYFVAQPAMADRLLEDTLAAVRRAPPDLIVSSNVGCAMHLAAGVRRAGLTMPVIHPLRLLAQQLARS